MANNFDLEPEIINSVGLKIEILELENFRFFGTDNNVFTLNSQNTLIYGENGSGKSSIFRAFEILGKDEISSQEWKENKNIYSDTYTSIKLSLSNGNDFILDDDHLEIADFQKELSILKPFLDYKSLLKINYRDLDFHSKKINIYSIVKELFKDYPIENNLVLSSIKNPDKYFKKLEYLLNSFLPLIRNFLNKFSNNFQIIDFIFDKQFTDDGKVEFVVNINLECAEMTIEKHHLFFNEAKLSSLAISIYFAFIKVFLTFQNKDSLKILILDDLLISLDMSNRMKLLPILKDDFSDFQIIFLTHDRELFEIYKNEKDSPFKNGKKFEIYLDKSYEIEKPFLKEHLDYFQTAKKYFKEFDYPASANYLRKEVERLKEIKQKQEDSKHNKNDILKKFHKLLQNTDLQNSENHSKVVGKLIGFKKGLETETSPEIEFDLTEIKSITDRILNPFSHDDNSKPLYKSELENALDIVEKIRNKV
ncbi:recombinational DNA repair ATPase (RecF pathway) [Thiovulum sp. ES]|nr:recombinational DNA repair ATPase (RecF pathway) [Thiovulum sp. ES]